MKTNDTRVTSKLRIILLWILKFEILRVIVSKNLTNSEVTITDSYHFPNYQCGLYEEQKLPTFFLWTSLVLEILMSLNALQPCSELEEINKMAIFFEINNRFHQIFWRGWADTMKSLVKILVSSNNHFCHSIRLFIFYNHK